MAASSRRPAPDPGGREHFAAFSFVDRIVELVAGRHARGSYLVPPAISAFPPCLVAEAVGQLAAWVAMDHIGFRGRPVAALANETRFHAAVAPGETLELSVDIESCDDEAVAYSGRARVGGADVIELVDCLGPMLPVEEFDSPAELASRLKLLRGAGATPGAFGGVSPLVAEQTGGAQGETATAVLRIPEHAPFFADHFPRRAVFPATLLLDSEIELAMRLAGESTHWPPGAKLSPSRMTHVKMRAFIPPGATLDVGAELTRTGDDSATVRLSATMDAKTVATARLEVRATGAAT